MNCLGAHRRAALKVLLLTAASGMARAAPASPRAIRAARLHQGEAALMRGDTEAAMQAFEQAGALGHDPDIELGLVRAAMQAGRYRQALGFAAHTAGEHVQDAACLVTYLWLLRLGGQDDFARQLWTQAESFKWSDADRAMLRLVHEAWSGAWPQVGGALRQRPLRLAPYAHGLTLPADARVVASGTLVRDAQGMQRVVVPSAVLSAGAVQRWWVRNGTGLTVAARVDSEGLDDGLAGALRPDTPLPGAAEPASRNAFPGSPAYAFAHATNAQPGEVPATASEAAMALSAWPLMRMGFAGQLDAQGGRLLGVDMRAGENPLGGPVLDAQGRLTGVAIGRGSRGAPESLMPVSELVRKGWAPKLSNTERPVSRLAADEVYERGLSVSLQVIRAPAD